MKEKLGTEHGMAKVITVALLRDLETQVHIKQEISYSRMVEILNEKVQERITTETAELQKRVEELEGQMPKWHYTGLPICCETGPWDGKRSDFVLACFDGLNPITARVYAGRMDGFEFEDWYDADDNSINAKVEKWMYLPL